MKDIKQKEFGSWLDCMIAIIGLSSFFLASIFASYDPQVSIAYSAVSIVAYNLTKKHGTGG